MLQDSALEYGDVVSLSPVPAEVTFEAEKIVLQVTKHDATNRDIKGKRKAQDDSESLQGVFAEVLGRSGS